MLFEKHIAHQAITFAHEKPVILTGHDACRILAPVL
jgi:hypothetical protein